MSFGVLFPGQGSQSPGMLPWLDADDRGGRVGATADADAVLAAMAATLGADWRAHLVDDPGWSARNAVAQPLVTGLCLAAWARLAPLLPVPTVIAGYSVGELAAFAAAGVFGSDTALVLAGRRAAVMDGCRAASGTGLLFVGDARPDLLGMLCERHDLAVAIRIDPGRAVLGGLREHLARAASDAVAAGAHADLLPIAVASHTRWLAEAVAPFAALLAAEPFATPTGRLICNFDAAGHRAPNDLRRALAGQLAAPVAWDRCMEAVAERRVRCVLEVGPGNALSRWWNALHPGVPARSADDFQTPEAVADWVGRSLQAG